MTLDQLTPEAKQKIDQYLDAVEDILRRQHRGREERSNIIDGLADQINDMLAKESAEGVSSLDQVQAVLSRLEAPEAYVSQSVDLPRSEVGTPHAATPQPADTSVRVSGHAMLGLAWAAWFVLAMMLIPAGFFVGFMVRRVEVIHHAGPHGNAAAVSSEDGISVWAMLWALGMLVALPGLLAPILTTGFGLAALGQIRNNPRRYTGWGLAVFDTLIFPCLVAALLLAQAMSAGLFYAIQLIRMLSGKPSLYDQGARWIDFLTEWWLMQPVGLLLGVGIVGWGSMKIVRRINATRPALD